MRRILFLLALACPVLLTGCGCDSGVSHESLLMQDLGNLEDAGKVCSTITDKASLDAAKAKLDWLVESHATLKKHGASMPALSSKEKETLQSRHAGRAKAAKEKLATEMARIQQIEGGGEVYRRMALFLADF